MHITRSVNRFVYMQIFLLCLAIITVSYINAVNKEHMPLYVTEWGGS